MLRALLLDLDGVVYRGEELVLGADHFIRWATGQGLDVVFLTNQSGRTPGEICSHLLRLGIESLPERVLTSSLASVHCLRRAGARRVFALGGRGLSEALVEGGFDRVETEADHVVIGGSAAHTFADLVRATRLVLEGASLVATNMDRLVDSESGPVPGNGATVSAVAYATRVVPIVAGKPERYLVDIALHRLGVTPKEVVLVGDSCETDIRAGRNAGVSTVLLQTGVGARFNPRDARETPDHEVRDHRELQHLIETLREIASSPRGTGSRR